MCGFEKDCLKVVKGWGGRRGRGHGEGALVVNKMRNLHVDGKVARLVEWWIS